MSVVDQTRAEWTSDAQQLLLHNIDWRQYEALLQAMDNRHLRLIYDRGNLVASDSDCDSTFENVDTKTEKNLLHEPRE